MDFSSQIYEEGKTKIRNLYTAVTGYSISCLFILRFASFLQIVESVDPVTCIKTCSIELTTNNLINSLLSLTVPTAIMKNAVLPGIDHGNIVVRHEAATLLLAIVHQIKAISLAVKESHKPVAVQSQITDFVLKTIPNLDVILRAWKRAFEADDNETAPENMESVQRPELLNHLNIILSILHLYNDVCPEMLNDSTDLQPSVLLTNLNNLKFDDDEAEINADEIKCMKVKVIQFLLVMNTSIFAPREKLFKEALLFLMSVIRQRAMPESYDTARSLLNATGLFEACDDQVDIWINGFLVVTDPREYEELTKWFMSVLKSAIKHTDEYINGITQAEETIIEQMVDFDVKKAEDIISELFDMANEACGLSDKESSTAETSLTDKLHTPSRKDDAVHVGINNLDVEYLKNVAGGTTKSVTRMNEQVINLNAKKAEQIIDELLGKRHGNGFLNDVNACALSTPSLTVIDGSLTDLDVEKINVTDDSFNKLRGEDFRSCGMQTCTSMSPLLCCALQRVSEESSAVVLAYLSYVTVHSLHHQVVPELLVHMTTDLTNLPVYKYLQSWLSSSKPVSLKNKLPSLRLLHKVSYTLLTNTKINVDKFSKLFDDGPSSCSFKYGDEEITIKHSLSLYDVRALLKMTTFYLAQLTQREMLQYDQNEKCKFMLMSLLSIARSMHEENASILVESAKCIFTHPILLHHFSPFCGESPKNSVKGMVTETILKICQVMQLQKKYGDTKMCNIISAFRDKFLAQLKNIIEKDPPKSCSDDYDIAIELLRILPLRAQDVVNLLLALMNLEQLAFISNDKRNMSVFGHVVPVLLDISCNEKSVLPRDQYNALDDEFVAKLSSRLVHLKSKKINNVEKWEETFATYLSIFPSAIAKFSNSTFACLLAKGISTSTIQLITTLITRNTKLIPSLVGYFLKANNPERMKQAKVVFPILGSNLQYKWNDSFLRALYECHSGDIVAYLTDPQNPVCWIEENIAAVVYLIENTFELDLCERTCDNISQSGDKLDMVSICFVQLLESLYKRYESLMTAKEKSLMDLIKILLHVMTATLKKESKNVEKLKVLCEKLDSAVISLRKFKRDLVFTSLSKSHSWPQYTRFSLRLGLKSAEDDEIRSSILKTLSSLCDIAYRDTADDEYAKTLFEMATSHSEFVNVMLGSSNIKGQSVHTTYYDGVVVHLFI